MVRVVLSIENTIPIIRSTFRRRRGLEARKNHIQPVGAWFSQVGKLHQVHHIWQYASLEERKAKREEAWKAVGWSDTVTKVGHNPKSCHVAAFIPRSRCAHFRLDRHQR